MSNRAKISFGSTKVSFIPTSRTIKDYLNKLKCPICQSQIEGSAQPKPNGIINGYCCSEPTHYKLYVDITQTPFLMKEDQVIFDSTENRYFVSQDYISKGTLIRYYPIANVVDPSTGKGISFNHIVFNFQKITGPQLLDKIKVVLMFS